MPLLKFNRNVILAGMIIVFICIGVYIFGGFRLRNVKEGFVTPIRVTNKVFSVGLAYDPTTKSVYSSHLPFSGTYKIDTNTGDVSLLSSVPPNPGWAIAVDKSGNVYTNDTEKNILYKISPSGQVLTQYSTPPNILTNTTTIRSIVIDSSNNMYYNSTNKIYKISDGSTSSSLWVTLGEIHIYSMCYDPVNNSIFVGNETKTIFEIPISSGSPIIRVNNIGEIPWGICIDKDRFMYISTQQIILKKIDMKNWDAKISYTEVWCLPYSVAIDTDNNMFYLGCRTDGIFKINLIPTARSADCVLSSDFEETGTCVPNQAGANCGPGTLMRPKKILTPVVGSGACNNPPVASGSCKVNNRDCAVDCVLSKTDYDGPGNCVPKEAGKDCGPGTLMKIWKVISNATGGGTCNNPPIASGDCKVNNKDCPVDCVLSSTDFEGAGTCVPKIPGANCGPGTLMKPKKVVSNAVGGGACNNPPVATGDCLVNNQVCPVDCVVRYDKEGGCSKTCGGGVQKLKKVIVTPAVGAGLCNFPDFKEEPCNTQVCKDCVVSGWTKDGTCTKQCGGGKQKFTRSVVTPAEGDGKCPTDMSKEEDCNTAPCPVNCKPGEWEDADGGKCLVDPEKPKNCGAGMGRMKQVRKIEPANSTGTCSDENSKTERYVACDLPECPVDCNPGVWSSWSRCEGECGTGMRTRTRTPKEGNSTGRKCSSDELVSTQQEQCNLPPCPIDCKPGVWSNWSKCEGSCGPRGGKMRRERTVVQPNETGRKCTPSESKTVEEMECDMPDCPIHCEVGPWSSWGPSESRDGINMRKRTRKVVLGNATGTPCTPEQSKTVEYKPCNSEKTQLPDLLDLQNKGFSGIRVYYQK